MGSEIGRTGGGSFRGVRGYYEEGGSDPKQAREQAAAAVRQAADRMGDQALHRDLQAVVYGELEVGDALSNVASRLAALPIELHEEGLRPALADALIVDPRGAVEWIDAHGHQEAFAQALGDGFRDDFYERNPRFIEAMPEVMASASWQQWEGRRAWLRALPEDEFSVAAAAIRERYKDWRDEEAGRQLVEGAAAERRER